MEMYLLIVALLFLASSVFAQSSEGPLKECQAQNAITQQSRGFIEQALARALVRVEALQADVKRLEAELDMHKAKPNK